MKGDKWREMQGDKAAASRPFSDFGDRQPSHWEVRTTIASSYLGNEGRQMKAGAAKSRLEWSSRRETNEGRQMKAGAAKSRPEWRSCRETNEGRSGQEQARMEIMQGDKWRETNEGRQMKAGAAKSRPEWRSCRETNEGRLGGSGRDFGDQQPNLWGIRTPIASSYLG